MLIIIILILFFITGCIVYVDSPTENFKSLVNRNIIPEHGEINFTGFYNNTSSVKSKSYYGIGCIFFYPNGYIMKTEGAWPDSNLLNLYFLNDSPCKITGGVWGVYCIENKVLKATIYCKYQSEKREQNCKYLLTNYEGYLKDSTTIENWRMVPPYPKIAEKFNRNIIESESLPHTYKFKYFPAKEKLDVTKAWISKYRKS